MTLLETKQAHQARSEYLAKASELLFSKNTALSAHLTRAKNSFEADFAVRPSGVTPNEGCPSCGLRLLKGWSCTSVKSTSVKSGKLASQEQKPIATTVRCNLCLSRATVGGKVKLSRKQRRRQRLSAVEPVSEPVLVRPIAAQSPTVLSKPVLATPTPPAVSRKKLRPKDKTLEAALKRSTTATAPSGFNIDFADILKM